MLVLLLIALQILDFETTRSIIRRGGYELNPLMRWVIERGGMKAMAFVKALLIIPAWLLAENGYVEILATVCAVYTVVVAWNYRVLRRLSK